MKHTSNCFLIFLTSFLFFIENVKAQNPTYPIIKMDIYTSPVAFDTSGGLPDLSDSTLFHVVMNVSLFDTTIIDKIYVVLSDSGNTGNRLEHTFNWDVAGSTGGGTSYFRNEYDLELVLGNFKDLLNYSATVRMKRTDGTFTDFIHFSR